MKTFMGIAASNGIAIAPAFRLTGLNLSVKKRSIEDPTAEIKRLHAAIDVSKDELLIIKRKALKDLSHPVAEVFQAHIAILADPVFLEKIELMIKQNGVDAAFALQTVVDDYRKHLQATTPDHQTRYRLVDVNDVARRVLGHLLGRPLASSFQADYPVIVVTHELTPSQTVQFSPSLVRGIVSDMGGQTSHAVIMSRGLAIPTVVGLQGALSSIHDGDIVIVNGLTGEVIVNPTDAQRATYTELIKEDQRRNHQLMASKQENVRADKKRLPMIVANIGLPSDVDGALKAGADGVGLFRTEFLFLSSKRLPTENEQFRAYKVVLTQMAGRPVTIRTADVGGDKTLPYLRAATEANPFLGNRAIRLAFSQPDSFRVQLRALLRAAVYGKLSVMFPLVTTLDELKRAKQMMANERAKLTHQHISVGDVRVGIMVETPAVAVLADQFASEVDFMSIGTNDLTQYVMAADRGNQQVADLYQPNNPAVFRLIKIVIGACHDNHIPVSVCGEMAADKMAIPILVGMGLDAFSANPRSINKVRCLIKRLNHRKMVTLANKVVTMAGTTNQVEAFVQQAVHNEAQTYK